MGWYWIGAVIAAITAGLMGVGFWLERRRPGLRWPIIIVGALFGLAIGFVMMLAFWAIQVRPHARRLITASAIAMGAGFVFLATNLVVGPSFDVGPVIGSGRIERPEHGFALTFPASWTVQEATPEGAQTILGEEVLPEGQSIVLAAERLGRSGTCFVLADDPSVRDDPTLLATYASTSEMELSEGGWYDEVDRTPVDLVAGPGWRLDASNETWTSSVYVLRGPGAIYALVCRAADPPEGRWLSIAETFEFLPDAATGSVPSSPVLGGGHIERPAEGFAITFPDDWVVEEVTAETHALVYAHLTPERRAALTTVLWADQPESAGKCVVVDFKRFAESPPAWTSVEAATSWFLAREESDPDVEPASSIEDLPAGRTGHITVTDTNDETYGTYYFTDGDDWLYLECWSPVGPDDHWHSIAESFEFLPEQA